MSLDRSCVRGISDAGPTGHPSLGPFTFCHAIWCLRRATEWTHVRRDSDDSDIRATFLGILAVAEGPRDALRQLRSCQTLHGYTILFYDVYLMEHTDCQAVKLLVFVACICCFCFYLLVLFVRFVFILIFLYWKIVIFTVCCFSVLLDGVWLIDCKELKGLLTYLLTYTSELESIDYRIVERCFHAYTFSRWENTDLSSTDRLTDTGPPHIPR